MATPLIFNMDDVLAQETPRMIVAYGAEHPVLGLTPETFGLLASHQAAAQAAIADGDAVKQAALIVDMIVAVTPSLAAYQDRLRSVHFNVLSDMLAFAMQASGFTQADVAVGEAPAGPESPPNP